MSIRFWILTKRILKRDIREKLLQRESVNLVEVLQLTQQLDPLSQQKSSAWIHQLLHRLMLMKQEKLWGLLRHTNKLKLLNLSQDTLNLGNRSKEMEGNFSKWFRNLSLQLQICLIGPSQERTADMLTVASVTSTNSQLIDITIEIHLVKFINLEGMMLSNST